MTSKSARVPGRMTTVLGLQPWWPTGTSDQRRTVAQAVQEERRRVEHRLARVRAHPDLAQKLCHALGNERLDQWNGYVPSKLMYGDVGQPNRCPRRRAIIEVLQEIDEREKAAAAAPDQAEA